MNRKKKNSSVCVKKIIKVCSHAALFFHPDTRQLKVEEPRAIGGV